MLCDYRIDRKERYQRHLALGILLPGVVIVSLIAIDYLFVASDDMNSNRRYIQSAVNTGDSSELESSSGRRTFRSFPIFGKSLKIVADGFKAKNSSSTEQSKSTGGIELSSKFSGDDLLLSVGDPLNGVYYEMTPPPQVTRGALQIDKERPPRVRSRIEPFGIKNAVTVLVMIDSLGNMSPFNEYEFNYSELNESGVNEGEMVPYALKRGSLSDAEKVYASLLTWTFYPAWDTRGRHATGFLTITHTPRNR